MKIKYFLILSIAGLCNQAVYAESPEMQVNNYIKWLNSLKAESNYKVVDKNDQRRVKQWKLFRSKKNTYYPIIKRRLNRELLLKRPSVMLLLDFGFNLSVQNRLREYSKRKKLTTSDRVLAGKTFRKIDHNDPLIRAYIKTYYWFVFTHSDSRPKGFLPRLDDILLPNKANLFKLYMPKDANHPHYKNTHFAIRVHSFGVYGIKSLPYLLGQLKPGMNANRQEKIMSILRYICTVKCAKKTYAIIKNGVNHKTFVHGIYILLDTGGPLGRDLVLKLDSSKFSGKSRNYLNKEKRYAKKMSYNTLHRYFRKLAGKNRNYVAPEYFKKRILLMDKYPSFFTETHPHQYLDSKLERKIMTDNLIKVRRLLFLRTEDRKLISYTNRIINALNFRDLKAIAKRKENRTIDQFIMEDE